MRIVKHSIAHEDSASIALAGRAEVGDAKVNLDHPVKSPALSLKTLN